MGVHIGKQVSVLTELLIIQLGIVLLLHLESLPLRAFLIIIISCYSNSREFRVTLPWKLLYIDDLVVIAETEDD